MLLLLGTSKNLKMWVRSGCFRCFCAFPFRKILKCCLDHDPFDAFAHLHLEKF